MSVLGVYSVGVCREGPIPACLPLSSGCSHLFRPHSLVCTKVIVGSFTSVLVLLVLYKQSSDVQYILILLW